MAEEQTAEEKYGNKLPQQVINQMAEVDALVAASQQRPGEPKEPDEDEPDEDEPDEDDENGEEPAEPPAEPAPPPPGQTAEDDWEQRARSAQGRLEHAVSANQQLSQRITQLENQLSTLRIKGEAPAPATPPPQPKKLIKDEELADYGDEFMDVVGRRAQETVMPVLETYEQRLARLEAGQKEVGQVVERGQQQDLYSTLYDEVPDWKTINHTQEFHNWLAYPDPFSGVNRKELLLDAFSRHDANRVVNFFRGFLTEATGLPQNSNGNGRPTPSNGTTGKPSLADFAAPGRARSAPQQHVPPDKPIYTSATVAKVSADKILGKYRGREAELEQLEQDIFRAQHEGRFIP